MTATTYSEFRKHHEQTNPVERKATMRAMRARGFSGYGDLALVDLPKPILSEGRVLVRMTAAGVTLLDYTILSGHYNRRKHHWSWETKALASSRRESDPSSRPDPG